MNETELISPNSSATEDFLTPCFSNSCCITPVEDFSTEENHRKVRVNVAHFWEPLSELLKNLFLVKHLKEHSLVDLVEEAPVDLTLASVFDYRNDIIAPAAPKITFSWEAYDRWKWGHPNSWDNTEYLFANDKFENIPIKGRTKNIYSSVATIMHDLDLEYPECLLNRTDPALIDRDFCFFIYSNGNTADPGVALRNDFFQELSKYKKVTSAGPIFNNTGAPLSRDKEIQKEFYRKFKFGITFENTSAPGYITEKIFNAYLGQSIPIYWGHESIKETFNPNSFVFVEDVNDAVKQVIELDTDPYRYQEMIQTPPFTELPKGFSRTYLIEQVEEIIRDHYKKINGLE